MPIFTKKKNEQEEENKYEYECKFVLYFLFCCWAVAYACHQLVLNGVLVADVVAVMMAFVIVVAVFCFYHHHQFVIHTYRRYCCYLTLFLFRFLFL